MKVLHERVAGTGVHKEMVKVAIRFPGEKPWTRKTQVLEYRTFFGVLQQMAVWRGAGLSAGRAGPG